MIVIHLVSGPGAGKSVLAARLFAQLKIDGFNAEYVPEYAKQLVWTGQMELLNNQHHIAYQQNKMINSLKNSVDIVVTDGSILHGLAYNLLFPDNTSDIAKTRKAIIDWYSQHENIVIFVDRGKMTYQEYGRYQKYEDALDVDAMLRIQLKQNSIEYTLVSQDSDSFEDSYKIIKERLRRLKAC